MTIEKDKIRDKKELKSCSLQQERINIHKTIEKNKTIDNKQCNTMTRTRMSV